MQKIILKDAENILKISVDKNILKTIPYFEALMSFENEEDVIMEVANVTVAYSIIRSFDSDKWKRQLEKISFRDFLGLEPVLDSSIKVPVEEFDKLLEIAYKVGFNDEVIKALNNNLPINYDLSLLPTELVQQMILKATQHKIISVGGDNSIKIWNRDDNKLIDSIRHKYASIRCLAYSPITQNIATGDYDNDIRIWDLTKKLLLKTLRGNIMYFLNTIAYSSDSKYIISGGNEPCIKIWDVNNGILLKTLHGHSGEINSVTYTFDDQYIISGSDDLSIKIWNANNGLLIHTLKGHMCHVMVVVISSDNKYIISSSNDNNIKIWDIAKGILVNTLICQGSRIRCIAFTHDDKYIISGSEDCNIKIWNMTDASLINTFEGHSHTVRCLACSAENQYIISADNYGIIKVWNIKGNLINTWKAHDAEINKLIVIEQPNDLVKRLRSI